MVDARPDDAGDRMALRVCGCLLRGALGVGSVLLPMPAMTGIGQFVLLGGAVVFVAAWVALGSERIACAGNRVALAPYVTVLDDYGPAHRARLLLNRVLAPAGSATWKESR